MSQSSGDHYNVSVGGSVGGSVTVGHGNIVGAVTTGPAGPDAAQLAAFAAEVEALRAKLDQIAPAEQVDEAHAKLTEFHAAATAQRPDLTTMQKVRNWFVDHLPALAGAVTSLVIHPVVGALVTSAGEKLTEEFRMRFGAEPGGAARE